MTTTNTPFIAAVITDDGSLITRPLIGDRGDALRASLDADTYEKVTAGGYDFWIDEDGIAHERAYNIIASAIVGALLNTRIHLLGPVLITKEPTGDCDETQPLDPTDIMRFDLLRTMVLKHYDLSDD
ncbi:hypothetical protein ACWKWA_15365 [Dermacoccus abyssi]